jgi:lysyl-tRNA synthetase class 2
MSEPIEKLRKIRLAKLGRIKKAGVNPYPSKFIGERIPVEEARGKKLDASVSIAGRIRAWRVHGKITFADLQDESEKIQICFKEDVLGPKKYEFLQNFDIGDFLGVSGSLFKTKAGELTILVSSYQILTKSLRPLPAKWHGLREVEERYRKRYLDLIMNPPVKRIFEVRSQVTQAMREFLCGHGYIEVETPVLQPLYGGGLARPFKTYHNVLGIPLYMRISTELYLKRLIVGGFEKVFEIAKVFRNEGIDRQHNPEFTILETMEAYIDYKDNMKLVEEMTEYAVRKILGTTEVIYQDQAIDFKTPWRRLTMVEAVKEATGVDFSKIDNFPKAVETAKELGVKLESFHNAVGMILAAIFESKVEKKLIQPTFIYDFPVETAPLAKKCSDDPCFTERFEHFIAGMECSNNYSELNDPIELAERFKDERKKERLGDIEAHQTDMDFIEAVEYGMPPTSGIGPGLDRLVMILTGSANMREVILFPTMRPIETDVIDNGVRGDKETRVVEEIVVPKEKIDIFYIDGEVKKKFPGMKAGMAIIKDVEVHRESKELEKFKQEVLSRFSGLKMVDIDNLPSIKAYREIFRAFSVDWHSRRPSVDALLRRVVQGKGLYRVNTLVDAYNLIVLESKIALGAFDYQRLSFPVILRLAEEGEKIVLLGETEPKKIKRGEMVYADQSRIMTLDLNYRDCDYTKITTNTKDVILFADGCPGISSDEVLVGLEKGIEFITRFCDGKLVKKFIVE